MGALQVETFSAPTLREALAKVRHELGADAMVLQTRQVQPRGIVGRRRGAVEITASRGTQVQGRLAQAAVNEPNRSIHEQLATLTKKVEDLCHLGNEAGSDEWNPLARRLRNMELPDEWVRDFLEQARSRGLAPGGLDDPEIESALIEWLAERLPADPRLGSEGAERAVIALVGPTGVGKTTTIAKLAANAQLNDHKRVALVTVDTFRIAAADHLGSFAEILNVPFSVAHSAHQLRTALDRNADADLILIDTTGRSPSDVARIEELGSLLGDEVQTHLVLDANMRDSSVRRTVERFASLRYARVIATKLDEAPGAGFLPLLARLAGVPIGHVTMGQDVPDDIEPADRRRLAEWVLGRAEGSRTPTIGITDAEWSARRGSTMRIDDRTSPGPRERRPSGRFPGVPSSEGKERGFFERVGEARSGRIGE